MTVPGTLSATVARMSGSGAISPARKARSARSWPSSGWAAAGSSAEAARASRREAGRRLVIMMGTTSGEGWLNRS